MDNGVFETLHGVVMFLSPGKGLPFTGKVDQGSRKGGVVPDPDSHKARSPQEGTDVRECPASGPVSDTSNLRVVWDATVIVALVPQNDDFRYGDEELLCGDSSTSTVKTVENAMDVDEVLPDEFANAGIVG